MKAFVETLAKDVWKPKGETAYNGNNLNGTTLTSCCRVGINGESYFYVLELVTALEGETLPCEEQDIERVESGLNRHLFRS